MAYGKMQVDAALVQELAALLKETDLSEIEVQDGERRIRVARQITVAASVPMAAAAAPPPAAAPLAEDRPALAAADHPGVVPSPMVGTVYLAPDPSKPDFVSVGSTVKEGDTLLIIEAMKVMNQITAPRAGTVTHIFVSNAQAVEFGEPLLVID